ncbi:MAG TPA: hypothetical protein VFN67_36595 [Polyangiales bacterium]|nr:hypothetical protein [Polyangiales bacterium]
MSSDLKQTLPSSETLDLCKTREAKDTSLSTTLIQPTSRSRQSELSRTRYWEERASGDAHSKRYTAHSNTRIGLGPNDPLVQAVQAVKHQLMQATQPLEKPIDRVAAPPVARPKRFLIASSALGIIACAAAAGALTNKPASKPHEGPALVKPATPKAAVTTPTARPAAPQTLENSSERAAADALFAGDYALAKRHYITLAQSHPDQPAFAEAARILSRDAAADTE